MSRFSSFFARLTAIAMSAVCTTAVCCIAPTAEISAASTVPYAADGVSYLDSSALSAKIKDTWAGNIGLYTDKNLTKSACFPLDSALDVNQQYYISAGGIKTYGWQCYIYAQGVFGQIFGELPLHGLQTQKDFGISYKKLNCVMNAANEASFRQFLECHVMPGAYMRTTTDINGKYDGSNGHSLLILAYNENGVTVQEGNALGHGEIRSVTVTWDNFNRMFLAGKKRYVSHVVQPIDSIYLADFGLSYNFDIPDEIRYENHSVQFNRTGNYELLDRSSEFEWSSSNEQIATVDENGNVCALRNGNVIITAADRTCVHTFDVNINAVDWELLGDADGDGTITPHDAIIALDDYCKTIMDQQSNLSDSQKRICDVDDNAMVESNDATAMLLYYTQKCLLNNNASPKDLWAKILA